jgi:hypothetical protein
VKSDLVRHLRVVREQHGRDVARGAGWVELPTALARKYPNAGREWVWQRVFPAPRIYVERATGQRHRHHLHEFVVHRAVKGAYGAPPSPSEPARTRDVTTTMIYTHVLNRGPAAVRSPADRLD